MVEATACIGAGCVVVERWLSGEELVVFRWQAAAPFSVVVVVGALLVGRFGLT